MTSRNRNCDLLRLYIDFVGILRCDFAAPVVDDERGVGEQQEPAPDDQQEPAGAPVDAQQHQERQVGQVDQEQQEQQIQQVTALRASPGKAPTPPPLHARLST